MRHASPVEGIAAPGPDVMLPDAAAQAHPEYRHFLRGDYSDIPRGIDA